MNFLKYVLCIHYKTIAPSVMEENINEIMPDKGYNNCKVIYIFKHSHSKADMPRFLEQKKI